jgi:ribosome-associated protein YbcJ (S4-like RNA binding protein)
MHNETPIMRAFTLNYHFIETFSLDKKNHVDLSKLLRLMDICYSKKEVEQLIFGRRVCVNGIMEIREHAKIRYGNIVEVNGHKIMIE